MRLIYKYYIPGYKDNCNKHIYYIYNSDYRIMANKRYKDNDYIHNPLTYDEIIELINYYLLEFQQVYNIESLDTITQSKWSAAMTYIGQHAFKNTVNVKYNCDSILDYTNTKLIYDVCLYYIYMCQLYNKCVSILNFSQLTNIQTITIQDWKNDKNDIYKSSIYKILFEMRETTLSDKLISNDYKSPVGIIAILNHERNWNLPGSITVNQNNISAADISTISSRYDSGSISDNLQNMASLPDNITDSVDSD